MSKELPSLFEIVANVLKISIKELNEESAFGETLNWDSLNHLKLIGELEKIYEIQIPNEDIPKYIHIRKIKNLLKDLKKL